MTEPAATEVAPADRITPFDEFIRQHFQGTANDELTLALTDVVAAVAEYRKAGSVTLTIGIKPIGDAGRNCEIACKVKPDPPTPAPTPSIYYFGNGGTVHREDPYQQSLVAEPAKPINPDTGEILTLNESD